MVSKILKEALKRAARSGSGKVTKSAKRIADLETKQEKGTITAAQEKELNKLLKKESDRQTSATIKAEQTRRKDKPVSLSTTSMEKKAAEDKSEAYSTMSKIRSGAKVKSEDDPRNYPRTKDNPFGQRDKMEKAALTPRKKKTVKKAAGGKVGKPRGVGCATRGYGKAMMYGGKVKGKN